MSDAGHSLRVLHLVPILDWAGGVETYLLSLFPRLEEAGIRQIVCFGKGRPEFVASSFCIPELNKLGRRHGRIAVSKLRGIIQAEKPHLIHVHHIFNVEAILYCLGIKPVVITTHGYQFICPASDFFYDRTLEICPKSRYDPSCFVIGWFKRCISRNPYHALALYRRAHWVTKNRRRIAVLISPSHYTAFRYVQAGYPEDRIHVLPYFCPIEPFPAPRPEPENPCVLFLGRFAEYKGVSVLIEALGLLPGVVGVIVGNLNSSNRFWIERLAKSHGCQDRVELQPWAPREKIVDLMSRASVFVFPSRCPETLGISGLEALACGVPVVASDVGGVREWLIPEKTGLLVPPGDPHALASALRLLLTNRSLRRSIGENGISLIRSKFSPSVHLVRLTQIYRQAMEMGC